MTDFSFSFFKFQWLFYLLSFFDTLVFSTAHLPKICQGVDRGLFWTIQVNLAIQKNTLVKDGQLSGLIWTVLTTI